LILLFGKNKMRWLYSYFYKQILIYKNKNERWFKNVIRVIREKSI
jgi:hypothetical protein